MFIEIFSDQLGDNDRMQIKFYYQEIARQAEDIQNMVARVQSQNLLQIYDVVVFFNAAYLSRSMSEAILKLF